MLATLLISIFCVAAAAIECSESGKVYYYRDCKEALLNGHTFSGIYSIKPDHLPPFNVYCDMETDDGGWTVIQRRMDGSVDFNRKWKDYVIGFGDLSGEFWLGLSKIHRITESPSNDDFNMSLRINYQQFGGEIKTATYHACYVLGAYSGYQLNFEDISGNVSESLTEDHNSMKFSTDDVDNDYSSESCAEKLQGGWWYNNCAIPSQFNEPYPQAHQIGRDDKEEFYSFEFSEMKLRQADESGTQFTDCKEALDAGYKKSGIFTINPDDQSPFKVYCDMETDGGGWTIFQRRQDGSENFDCGWGDYEKGFGDLNGEFWLGLDKIHRLISLGDRSHRSTLRIDMSDLEGNERYAKYTTFDISDSTNKYRLSVAGYIGDSGDSLVRHNGMMFTTKDNDNDRSSDNCATYYSGGWWYLRCHYANLNGVYGSTSYGLGVNWSAWKGFYYSLKTTEMKMR